MMKKISVVVPVYNVEKYLDRCVESILRQSYKNMEVILVNDGSTDSSGEKCEYYSNLDKRVNVIHKSNGGLSSARNAGLAVCTGDYISFIDSDDWIEQDMYADMMKHVDEFQSDIVICRKYRVDESDNKTIESYMKYPGDTVMNKVQGLAYLMSFRGFDMSVCDKLFAKEVIGEIRFPEGKTCEDSFTTYLYFARADKISYINKPYYNYFYRLSSITRKSSINKTVIEATLGQKAFIQKNFPELIHEANTSHICGFLSVYNSYLQRSMICVERKQYQKEVRKLYCSGLTNKNISLIKKMQITMFICCPRLYDVITSRKLEKI